MNKLLAAAVVGIALSSGCSVISHKELLSGINTPRKEGEVDITYEYVQNVDFACRDIIKATGAKVLPWLLATYAACATIPTDAELKPGQRPWCKITLQEGEANRSIIEHEVEHCYGWGHAFM